MTTSARTYTTLRDSIAKTVGGLAQTVYRGVERVRSRFILTMAASNLA